MGMDYSKMPYGKQVDKKKRKKYNGYKDKRKRVCYYCGTSNAERHEVYGGPNRQISIDEGFQVDLCPYCHLAVTENTERGQEISDYWQKHFQRVHMDKLIDNGMSEEEALRFWMSPKFIGRNYIQELEP